MPSVSTLQRIVLKICAALLLSGTFHNWATAQSHELWKINLTGQEGIQGFERSGNGLWIKQQGVIFLTPERVLVYQVNKKARPAALAQRSINGGSGNFILLARILDARTGREIKRVQFLTSAGYSAILPTHDGKFLVRAGDVLGFYSENFALLWTKKLPIERTAPVEYWEVRTTPSGKQVALAHQVVFVQPDALPDGTLITRGKSESDVEIVDADTFESIMTLHLPYYLPLWSPHERFLLTTAPERPLIGTEFGTIDFRTVNGGESLDSRTLDSKTMDSNGQWAALHPAWQDPSRHCFYAMDLLVNNLMAARGCARLVVFPRSGEKVLDVAAQSGEQFVRVASADHYLATKTERYTTYSDGRIEERPLRIHVYDLNTRDRMMSVNLEKHAVYFAISAQGLLAVIDGDALKVYERQN